MLGRELRREITARYRRQQNGKAAAMAVAEPAAAGI